MAEREDAEAVATKKIDYIVCGGCEDSEDLPGEYQAPWQAVRVLDTGESPDYHNCDICGEHDSDQMRTAIVIPKDAYDTTSDADALASRLAAVEARLGALELLADRIGAVEAALADHQQQLAEAASEGSDTLRSDVAELRISQQTLMSLMANLLGLRG